MRAAWRALLVGVALSLVTPVAAAGGLGDQLKKLVAHGAKDGQQLGFAASPDRQAGPLSLDQAVARVRKAHPKAEIVSAESRETERGQVHVVKMLRQNGKLKVYRFDAETGAELD